MIFFSTRKTVIKSISPDTGEEKVILTIEPRSLHQWILQKVGIELSKMSEVCYYPNIINLYNELLHKVGADEKDIKDYINENYPKEFGHIVRSPENMIYVLIAQDFCRRRDDAAALATMNMFTMKMYQNLMFKYIKYCNPDYFRGVLNDLSRNHIFVQKQTIGQALLHFSEGIYTKYKNDLKNDNHMRMARMMQDLRNRLNQSIKSFTHRYMEIAKNKGATRLTNEEMPQDENANIKIERLSGIISREVTVYSQVDLDAVREAQMWSKYNKKISLEYAKGLSNTKYTNNLELLIKLYLNTIQKAGSKFDYITHARKLMAIKHTRKPVYFKKELMKLHDMITVDLGLDGDFRRLSVQSQAVSRLFLAYYIAMMIWNHLHSN